MMSLLSLSAVYVPFLSKHEQNKIDFASKQTVSHVHIYISIDEKLDINCNRQLKYALCVLR